MKKRATFFLFLFPALSLLSQPTLTGAVHFPAAGDVYTSHTANGISGDPGPAGANQTWNFSSLNVLGGSLFEVYSNPATTAYAASFPNANLAFTDSSGKVSYYSSNSSYHQEVGTGSPGNTYVYASPLDVMHYPLVYTDDFTTSNSTIVPAQTFYWTYNRNIHVTADAYGTLQLPSGTYNNVLRVKTSRYVSWTASPGGPLGGNGTTYDTLYQWFDAAQRFPLLSIEHFSVQSMIGSFSKTSVRVSDAVMRSPEISDAATFQVFPNPATQQTNLHFSLQEKQHVTLRLFDLSGREIRTLDKGMLDPGDHREEFFLQNIEAGVYLLELHAGEHREQRRIIVQ